MTSVASVASVFVRLTLVAVAIGALLTGVTPLAWGQEETNNNTPVDVSTDPVDLGIFGQPIRFEAAPGTTLTLGSGRRLIETVEIRTNPRGDGLVVIADLTTDTYVDGIAEMPARWPAEALRAQAIAARTYAWYQIGLGTFQRRGFGYDICATTACQVFRGREVVETPEVGQNWADAVASTSGQVLTFDGKPILARYFSTSGGQTRNNEDVFSSEGPFPYLKGFDDPYDEISPLHTWEAVFTREQFDDLLARGETLAAATPVADVTVEQRPGGQPDQVTVTGLDGTAATVTAGQFKDFLNGVAPDVFPADFPGPREDGEPLPSTVPSSRFVVDVQKDQVVLDGSGWGHGVGMGQYGAYGRALEGQSAEEILAAYYNGLVPTAADDLPTRVRVGLADDALELELVADGPMRVVVGNTVLAAEAVGAWRVTDAGSDTADVVAPAGYGSALIVSPTTVSRGAPFNIEPIVIEAVVNKTARARLVATSAAGVEVGGMDLGVVAGGRQRLVLSPAELGLDDGDGTLAVVAIDETGDEAGESIAVSVRSVTSSGRPRSVLELLAAPLPARSTAPDSRWLALAGLVGVAAGLLAGRFSRLPGAGHGNA